MSYAMDWVIDFIGVGDGDAIVIWGRNPNDADYVFFLDGGKTGDGKKVLENYNTYIKPYLQPRKAIGFINSHPHADHINGLIEIIETLGTELTFGIYNDPVECITEEHRARIKKAYLNNEDADISHLYKTFEEIEKLNNLCAKFNIKRYRAYSDINFFDGAFRILSPSEDFYVNLVQYFSDVDFLKTVDYSKKVAPVINEYDENLKPCAIVDEINDASPENLTSTVIQLIDTNNLKYILTADAGVDAFDYMDSEGFDPANTRLVQLPHHGSRRNVNSKWLSRFNPSYYIASAEGNVKHPRKAVINCIKRNLVNCAVYSTHISGSLSCVSNNAVFPARSWGPAAPL